MNFSANVVALICGLYILSHKDFHAFNLLLKLLIIQEKLLNFKTSEIEPGKYKVFVKLN